MAELPAFLVNPRRIAGGGVHLRCFKGVLKHSYRNRAVHEISLLIFGGQPPYPVPLQTTSLVPLHGARYADKWIPSKKEMSAAKRYQRVVPLQLFLSVMALQDDSCRPARPGGQVRSRLPSRPPLDYVLHNLKLEKCRVLTWHCYPCQSWQPWQPRIVAP